MEAARRVSEGRTIQHPGVHRQHGLGAICSQYHMELGRDGLLGQSTGNRIRGRIALYQRTCLIRRCEGEPGKQVKGFGRVGEACGVFAVI